MKYLAVCLLLVGCAGNQCPAPAIAYAPPPPVIEPAEGPVKVPGALAELAAQYHSAALVEGKKVTQPGATVEYVQRVHLADNAARNALALLSKQGRNIKAEALQHARDAVHELQAALDAQPDGKGGDGDP